MSIRPKVAHKLSLSLSQNPHPAGVITSSSFHPFVANVFKHSFLPVTIRAWNALEPGYSLHCRLW